MTRDSHYVIIVTMIKTTLLTSGNQKILKGEKMGYITKGIHLAPANLAGYEVCQWRSKGCTASCLNTAGRGQMNSVQQSRIAKTKLFFEQQFDFLAKLSKEIASTIKSSLKKEMEAVFRLNLTSDISWESVFFNESEPKTIFDKFPETQFYDYTKSFKRMSAFLGNNTMLAILLGGVSMLIAAACVQLVDVTAEDAPEASKKA